MASFDYCKKCEFPRWIEGYTGPKDYIENGWVQFTAVTNRTDKNGERHEMTVTTWLCPVCAEEEDKRRLELMDIASVRTINRRGTEVNERST